MRDPTRTEESFLIRNHDFGICTPPNAISGYDRAFAGYFCSWLSRVTGCATFRLGDLDTGQNRTVRPTSLIEGTAGHRIVVTCCHRLFFPFCSWLADPDGLSGLGNVCPDRFHGSGRRLGTARLIIRLAQALDPALCLLPQALDPTQSAFDDIYAHVFAGQLVLDCRLRVSSALGHACARGRSNVGDCRLPAWRISHLILTG